MLMRLVYMLVGQPLESPTTSPLRLKVCELDPVGVSWPTLFCHVKGILSVWEMRKKVQLAWSFVIACFGFETSTASILPLKLISLRADYCAALLRALAASRHSANRRSAISLRFTERELAGAEALVVRLKSWPSNDPCIEEPTRAIGDLGPRERVIPNSMPFYVP